VARKEEPSKKASFFPGKINNEIFIQSA
jgi:hypothetical protein